MRRQPLDDEMVSPAPSPAVAVEQRERERLLRRALEKVDHSRRATFVMFEIEGYSGDEIARIQDISLNTVWTRIHRARRELAAALAALQSREDSSP
jgi:RNA polymerase sigma-70 factor, ECF subfamily